MVALSAGMKNPLLPIALFMILASSASAAEVPTVLETPSPRPFFAVLQLGPAIEVAGDWGTQLKLGQDFGYHLSGGTTGLALGVSLEESFGNCTDAEGVSCFSFQGGPKAWWTFQPIADLGLFVGPAARLAYTHVRVSVPGFGASGSFNGVGLQLSLEARMVLLDRLILFFRPITLDMIVGGSDENLGLVYDDNFAIRYDITFGGGLAF